MSLNSSPKKSQETINELNKKLLVLKNALLEERKKTIELIILCSQEDKCKLVLEDRKINSK